MSNKWSYIHAALDKKGLIFEIIIFILVSRKNKSVESQVNFSLTDPDQNGRDVPLATHGRTLR